MRLDELQLDESVMHEPEVQIDEPAKQALQVAILALEAPIVAQKVPQQVLQVAILALQGPRSPG